MGRSSRRIAKLLPASRVTIVVGFSGRKRAYSQKNTAQSTESFPNNGTTGPVADRKDDRMNRSTQFSAHPGMNSHESSLNAITLPLAKSAPTRRKWGTPLPGSAATQRKLMGIEAGH